MFHRLRWKSEQILGPLDHVGIFMSEVTEVTKIDRHAGLY